MVGIWRDDGADDRAADHVDSGPSDSLTPSSFASKSQELGVTAEGSAALGGAEGSPPQGNSAGIELPLGPAAGNRTSLVAGGPPNIVSNTVLGSAGRACGGVAPAEGGCEAGAVSGKSGAPGAPSKRANDFQWSIIVTNINLCYSYGRTFEASATFILREPIRFFAMAIHLPTSFE